MSDQSFGDSCHRYRELADWFLPKVVELYDRAADSEDDQVGALMAATLRRMLELATLNRKDLLVDVFDVAAKACWRAGVNKG